VSLPSGFGEMVEQLRRSTVVVGGDRRTMGSGLIIGREGTIATNAHVVRSATMRVQLWDGRVMEAALRERDPARDLALLSVRADNLPAASLGDSAMVRPGELVVAVGNPLGFIGAVTSGVVCAVGPVRGLGPSSWIQSDVRLAPGNSGGPLSDASGRVIGLNTMVSGRLGLAVPTNALRHLLTRAKRTPRLGITVHPATVSLHGRECMGLVIMSIGRGSPAELASLMVGDILIGVDGDVLRGLEDLDVALADSQERVLRVQFLRGDRALMRSASLLLPRVQRNAA